MEQGKGVLLMTHVVIHVYTHGISYPKIVIKVIIIGWKGGGGCGSVSIVPWGRPDDTWSIIKRFPPHLPYFLKVFSCYRI